MIRSRPPVLLFESDRGRDLRIFSCILWAAALGVAVYAWLSVTDVLPGGDSVRALFLGQVAIVLMAFLTDRRRRRTISRVYRAPEGLVFEMTGLLAPFRHYVRTEDLGLIRAIAPDAAGRMGLRLPDDGPALVMHTGSDGFNLGLPEPKHRKR